MASKSKEAADECLMCTVCGMPWNVFDLIRFTWRGHDGPPPYTLIIAEVPKSNDVMVCMDCIRQIKRLPFSALEAAVKVTRK